MRLFTVVVSLGILFAACGESKPDPKPQAPWPEWAFHHWVWEDESTQESALALVNDYLDHDIPVGAVIIDSPWETGYNTFEFDPGLYPDPQEMIDTLQALDVRVFLWIVPAINVDVTDLYAEAADNGYFMLRQAGSPPMVVEWWKGSGSFIDYYNPQALDWWHGLMDKALDLGIDGWKCDGLDFQVMAAPYSPGLGREVQRLDYSHTYYQDFFDYTRERLGTDRIITARPVDNYGFPVGGDDVAFAPVEITWAGWVGDQDSDFGGLQAALRNMYYSAEYGYLAFGSDIGGYREDGSALGRTKESFIRWAQLGALCPVMENGGGGEHRPWMFDEETTGIYRRFVNLHYALIPYLMREGLRSFEAGISLMRFVDNQEFHYLLGPDILVAPMLTQGTSRTVAFPEGFDWVYLFDRTETYAGGSQQTLDVPLDEFPVFLKAGSVIESELQFE